MAYQEINLKHAGTTGKVSVMHFCRFFDGPEYALLSAGRAERRDEAFTGVTASAKHRQKAELSP